MTTEIQNIWLDTLCNKIAEIDDPDPDVIRNLSYRWRLTNLKDIGKIPKIRFEPYGNDTQIKAEIMRNAGLNPSGEWKKRREQIRQKFGIKVASGQVDRELARKFNKISNEYWTKVRRAMKLLQDAQKRFCKSDQPLADPTKLIITDLIPGFRQQTEPEAESEPEHETDYEQELMEVE